MNDAKRIAYTVGEPAGIGPDLAILLAQQHQDDDVVVICDPLLLQARAEQLGCKISLEQADLTQAPTASPAGLLRYYPINLDAPAYSGQLNPDNAKSVLACLTFAAKGCLSGQFDAVVTGPVHKGVINDAGIAFSGHTEFFAELASVEKVVMMLASGSLRVALVTTHLPLRDVCDAITQPVVQQTLTITQQSLQTQFGLEHPRIAVCGLNPHAGESGHLGREEIEVIEPVIQRCQQQGMVITGPWPADTIFLPERLENVDVVVAMYHDQGLPVLKHAGFSRAVNITLGLPFIRTSVDHGTALELAGTGHIHTGSLHAALTMASDMINSQRGN